MSTEEPFVQCYVRYTKLARDAREHAANAEDDAAAEVYLRIAASWQALADEMEKSKK